MKTLLGIGAFVLFMCWLFGSFDKAGDHVGAFTSNLVNVGYTNPQAPVQRQILGRERDVQGALGDQIYSKRTKTTGAKIAEENDPGSAIYNELSGQARKSYLVHLAARKLLADVKGTRVPTQTSAAARGNNSEWQLVRNEDGSPIELFEDDIVCASGIVTNRDLTDQGQIIEVNPDGIRLKQAELPDGFSQRYEEFPMMAFLGRVNGNNNTIFHIKNGCHSAPVSGTNLQIVVNVAYRQHLGWEAPSVATNKGNGNFVIERIEHRQQTRVSNSQFNPNNKQIPAHAFSGAGKIYIVQP